MTLVNSAIVRPHVARPSIVAAHFVGGASFTPPVAAKSAASIAGSCTIVLPTLAPLTATFADVICSIFRRGGGGGRGKDGQPTRFSFATHSCHAKVCYSLSFVQAFLKASVEVVDPGVGGQQHQLQSCHVATMQRLYKIYINFKFVQAFLKANVGVVEPGVTASLLASYGRLDDLMHFASYREVLFTQMSDILTHATGHWHRLRRGCFGARPCTLREQSQPNAVATLADVDNRLLPSYLAAQSRGECRASSAFNLSAASVITSSCVAQPFQATLMQMPTAWTQPL